ncbi:hypothetical protein ACQ4M3_03300 [Leptolyngbya sp. AN03gr2]|uniref:hypothetical protein n=1 Tax=unclassified Leptolyngbya TaxID=2650499 RepID=UPI003D321932
MILKLEEFLLLRTGDLGGTSRLNCRQKEPVKVGLKTTIGLGESTLLLRQPLKRL